ncbi:uncharacterized protein LOC124450586 [Xenia sp. Carnegie-2017]|uniref:uncharacterized protein LOC124450586 n=1 Tax=Xenia sp. Carnegie-2017 TaxID=2897299 RepID=UPI001F04B0C7|nr:uncharacterized protein LOC124450586 [Xenia sp. Carnegie-2017]
MGFEFKELENEPFVSYINKEYDDVDINDNNGQILSSEITNERLENTTNLQNGTNICKSLIKSTWMTIHLLLAIIPSTAMAMALIFLSINTTYGCLQWQNHYNKTLPLSVRRTRVYGDNFQTMVIFSWYPLTMILLFSWREFKTKYLSVAYIAVIFGLLVVIYDQILLEFQLYNTEMYYRYPRNVVFCVMIVCSASVMVYNIRSSDNMISYSNVHIMAVILIEVILCVIISYIYKYGAIVIFNKVQEPRVKFFIAASPAVMTLVPALICMQMALRKSSELVHPGRCFVLVYFIRGGAIFLFRTMQSDFQSIWLFVGLSLSSSISGFFVKTTRQICFNFWKRTISKLHSLGYFLRVRALTWDTAHARRLQADLEIQDMLFEYSTIVLSQAYFTFYHLQSFEIQTWPLILEFLERIAIGLAIEFIFNCLSNHVQMYHYNIPIGRVWRRYWKRHLLANFIFVFVLISYFSRDFMSVFQSRYQETRNDIRNCTTIF